MRARVGWPFKPLTTLLDCFQTGGANAQTVCMTTVAGLQAAKCN